MVPFDAHKAIAQPSMLFIIHRSSSSYVALAVGELVVKSATNTEYPESAR